MPALFPSMPVMCDFAMLKPPISFWRTTGYDFFLNVDNTFLLTELSKVKEADQPLIRYWFKYGLVLCGLGILHDQIRKQNIATKASKGNGENDGEDEEESGENLKLLSKACSGLAQVIVPIIRALYRGPEASS